MGDRKDYDAPRQRRGAGLRAKPPRGHGGRAAEDRRVLAKSRQIEEECREEGGGNAGVEEGHRAEGEIFGGEEGIAQEEGHVWERAEAESAEAGRGHGRLK